MTSDSAKPRDVVYISPKSLDEVKGMVAKDTLSELGQEAKSTKITWKKLYAKAHLCFERAAENVASNEQGEVTFTNWDVQQS